MSARYQLRKAQRAALLQPYDGRQQDRPDGRDVRQPGRRAQQGIEPVRVSGPQPERDGQDYFVLQAANGEIVGQSEMYRSSASLENGLQAVMRVAESAEVFEVE